MKFLLWKVILENKPVGNNKRSYRFGIALWYKIEGGKQVLKLFINWPSGKLFKVMVFQLWLLIRITWTEQFFKILMSGLYLQRFWGICVETRRLDSLFNSYESVNKDQEPLGKEIKIMSALLTTASFLKVDWRFYVILVTLLSLFFMIHFPLFLVPFIYKMLCEILFWIQREIKYLTNDHHKGSISQYKRRGEATSWLALMNWLYDHRAIYFYCNQNEACIFLSFL